ncbi:hypothetical protein SAMN03097699_2312 [Flavobacteriaceae bacterium MAR_2010_188]|nr:hypothetical protein SAMN03097699_2312 [Flavobacteriaceae bacterium MAR_2010_188]
MKTFKIYYLYLAVIFMFSCAENNANDEQEIRNLIAQ